LTFFGLDAASAYSATYQHAQYSTVQGLLRGGLRWQEKNLTFLLTFHQERTEKGATSLFSIAASACLM
jgi:hypothetical protein